MPDRAPARETGIACSNYRHRMGFPKRRSISRRICHLPSGRGNGGIAQLIGLAMLRQRPAGLRSWAPWSDGFASVVSLGFAGLGLLAGCLGPPAGTLLLPANRRASPWFATIVNFSSFRPDLRRAGVEAVTAGLSLYSM